MNIPSHLRYAPSATLTLKASRYANGRLAIQAIDRDTGEPVAVLTVNLPDVPLAPDEVLLKDYSENQGVFKTLHLAGIVEPLATVRCGYAEAIKCRLLKDLA
ncbi:MAG: hypothetical protein JZU60_02775 [Ilumatobacteraceae bacterium]|nr:hypothetical protein [Ilumatobacteraceae bacterium]